MVHHPQRHNDDDGSDCTSTLARRADRRLKTAAETRRGTWDCAACEHEAADGSAVDGSDADDDFTAPNDSRLLSTQSMTNGDGWDLDGS